MTVYDLATFGHDRNEGERILIEISTHLNAGKLPSEDAIKALRAAVKAMIAESDTQMRLHAFTRALGLENRPGRPPINDNLRARAAAERQASAYWIYWLQGSNKTQARRLAAEELQRSGNYPPGSPSESTIRDNVGRYPKMAARTFRTWRILCEPSDSDIERAVTEIRKIDEKLL
jgi:hypothetical protein